LSAKASSLKDNHHQKGRRFTTAAFLMVIKIKGGRFFS
jgi:hypothetical protein